MRINVIQISLICLFLIGSVLSIVLIGNLNSKQPQYNPQPHADWDTYTFEQYINEEADLVAFVTVQKVEDKKKINKDDLDAKLSTLQLDEILFNKLPSTSLKNVVLDQATEFVQPGEKYLMFLTKKGEYFYEIGAEGKIKINDGKFKTHIKGIEGEYTQEEFSKQFEVKVQELKESKSGN